MSNSESKEIEKEINYALKNFCGGNQINSETKFRKEFHTKFFEILKNRWSANNSITTKLEIKYGLIHNSVHCNFLGTSCEIGDFLLVIKDKNSARAILIQVKCLESTDNNKKQKKLYSIWPKFTISRPKSLIFKGLMELNVKKEKDQSLYFEYSKEHITIPSQYLIYEIKEKNSVQIIRDSEFEYECEQKFSAFFGSLLLGTVGRSFGLDDDIDSIYKLNHRIEQFKKLGINNPKKSQTKFADDWDLIINSILKYSQGKKSDNGRIDRQNSTILGYTALTNDPKKIAEIEDDDQLRIVEIEVKGKENS